MGGGVNIGTYPSHTNMEDTLKSLEVYHQRPSEVIIIYADTIVELLILLLSFHLASAQRKPSQRSTAMMSLHTNTSLPSLLSMPCGSPDVFAPPS